jgi:hypothetical protein
MRHLLRDYTLQNSLLQMHWKLFVWIIIL